MAGGHIQSLGPWPLVLWLRTLSSEGVRNGRAYLLPDPKFWAGSFVWTELWLSSSMNHSLLRPGVDSPGPASVTTAVNEEAYASVPLVQYGRGGGAESIDLLIEII